MINYTLVGMRIKKTRKLKGLSQAALAELTDLSVSYISFIENAKRKASLQSLILIAEMMDTTLDTLLNGSRTNKNREYRDEVILLLEDCSNYERQIIFEQILFLKKTLRDCLQLF